MAMLSVQENVHFDDKMVAPSVRGAVLQCVFKTEGSQ